MKEENFEEISNWFSQEKDTFNIWCFLDILTDKGVFRIDYGDTVEKQNNTITIKRNSEIRYQFKI
jgi:hypothetical protein